MHGVFTPSISCAPNRVHLICQCTELPVKLYAYLALRTIRTNVANKLTKTAINGDTMHRSSRVSTVVTSAAIQQCQISCDSPVLPAGWTGQWPEDGEEPGGTGGSVLRQTSGQGGPNRWRAPWREVWSAQVLVNSRHHCPTRLYNGRAHRDRHRFNTASSYTNVKAVSTCGGMSGMRSDMKGNHV